MFKIALPIRDGYVSPAFDFARRLLVVEFEDAREAGRSEIALVPETNAQRAARLVELQVQLLICGAISRDLAQWLLGAGIEILPYVSGLIDEVLKAYVTGQLTEPRFVLPGCWPGARNGFRRCRRRLRGRG
jgi:predicted Fe-Mo cluster-binding NifX family protein